MCESLLQVSGKFEQINPNVILRFMLIKLTNLNKFVINHINYVCSFILCLTNTDNHILLKFGTLIIYNQDLENRIINCYLVCPSSLESISIKTQFISHILFTRLFMFNTAFNNIAYQNIIN